MKITYKIKEKLRKVRERIWNLKRWIGLDEDWTLRLKMKEK
jgi:hypothetical protein